MKKKIVGIYSIIHFIIDLACAILVTNLLTQKMGISEGLFIAVIVYNFFAFAVQFPIGIIGDALNKNALYSAIGCVIVAIAYLFSRHGIISCIIAGIGNAMFHVGGGIDVLNISNKKASLSGIFVSTGAMGIFLGTKSASFNFDKYYLVISSLILSALILIWLYSQIKNKVSNEKIVKIKLRKEEWISIVMIFLIVCIRSYLGMILAFPWKSTFIMGLVATLGVVFGNSLGGIIGDKFGFNKIPILVLISSICFIFSFTNPVIGIIAIFLFNTTMPITLVCLSNIFNKNKGLAFGMLTLALFIGVAPTFFGFNQLFTQLGLFSLSLITAILLFIALYYYNETLKEGDKKNENV